MWTLKFQVLKLDFKKGKGVRDQVDNNHRVIENAREFQKNIYFCCSDKVFDYVNHNNLWNIFLEMGTPDHLACLLKICMQVKKKQLELDTEQQTGSKLEKEYVKAEYCHPAYLTSMQSTSCEILDWMKHKVESRLLGEI